MPTKGPKASKAGKKKTGKGAEAYEHKEEKLLLRPDVGLQPQFTVRKPPTAPIRPQPRPVPLMGHQHRPGTGRDAVWFLETRPEE